MPDVSNRRRTSDELALLARPMPYSRILSNLRVALQQPWLGDAAMSPSDAKQYSADLKVTLLTWMAKLSLPETARAAQGHHRQHGGNKRVRLYSRDDIFPALEPQWHIITAARR